MKNIIVTGLAATLLITGCENELGNGAPPIPSRPLPALKQSRTFSGCTEIDAILEQTRATRKLEDQRYVEWIASGGRWGEAVPISTTAGITNTQETSIDEGDRVKASSRYIYVAQTRAVQIVSRVDRRAIGRIDTATMSDPDLYVVANKLVVIGKSPAGVELRIYRENATGLPSLESSETFSGRAIGTRVKGTVLYLVTVGDLDDSTSSDGKIAGIDCARVRAPRLDDLDMRMTAIHPIDVVNPNPYATAIATIGGGETIYMSEDSLYLVKRGMSWFGWDMRPEVRTLGDRSILTRFDFSNDVSFVGDAIVRGEIENARWLDEKPDQNAIVTVSTEHDSNWTPRTLVSSFSMNSTDGQLTTWSVSSPFGEREDVRSVRYVNDHLYVVTFEKTDPLFSFDLSDATDPKLEGHLEIPGFSSYLHDVSDGLLIGLGYDADDQGTFSLASGIQVSLFDVRNPGTPTVVTQEVRGTRGSFLPATVDAHAFSYDPNRERVSVPMSVYTDSEGMKSGASIMRIANRTLVEEAFVTHSDLVPGACEHMRIRPQWWNQHEETVDIDRVFSLDGSLITASRFGLKFHDAANPASTLASVGFDNRVAECADVRAPQGTVF